MNHTFKPAWWLRNAHLQTMWPALCRRRYHGLPLKRERIDLPDGDFIDLEWTDSPQSIHPRSTPLVLVLHGFEGSIQSHYVKGMLHAILQLGWRAVFMNFRGCSGEPNRLSRGYHSGDTADVSYVTRLLLEREPHAPIAAIGFSLGGNVLLKWLGETGQNNPLKAAAAISVPFELKKAAARIQYGVSRIYQWHFMRYLRKRLMQKFQVRSSPLPVSQIAKLKTIYDVDNKVTAPLHDFIDANDYYSTASSRQYLRTIAVPTLIVHAKDDPFMTADAIPEPHELSQHITLEVSEAGGHVGFVSGRYPWRPHYWLEKRVPAFLCDQLAIFSESHYDCAARQAIIP